MNRQDEQYLRRTGVARRNSPARRARLWMHDTYLLHYCVRCDRRLLPWQSCRHNPRWSIRRFDR